MNAGGFPYENRAIITILQNRRDGAGLTPALTARGGALRGEIRIKPEQKSGGRRLTDASAAFPGFRIPVPFR